MFLAAEVQSTVAGLATWQFLIAIVPGPVLTIAAILWTYTMNNRKAEQARAELSRQIERLDSRVTEVKTDLGASIKDLKNDMNAQMNDLKAVHTTQASQLRNDMVTVRSEIRESKSDIKDLLQSEMKRNFAELQVEILKAVPAEKKAGSAGSGSAA